MSQKLVMIQAVSSAPLEKVWRYFVEPEHIVRWNYVVDNWHCPRAENDLTPGGRFNYRMEARDGSFGFDFSGEYEEIRPHELITYHLDDGRLVEVAFQASSDQTNITQKFEAEEANPMEFQKKGWQAILDRFAAYVEDH